MDKIHGKSGDNIVYPSNNIRVVKDLTHDSKLNIQLHSISK